MSVFTGDLASYINKLVLVGRNVDLGSGNLTEIKTVGWVADESQDGLYMVTDLHPIEGPPVQAFWVTKASISYLIDINDVLEKYIVNLQLSTALGNLEKEMVERFAKLKQ